MYTSIVYAFLRSETPYWDTVAKYLPPEAQDRVLEVGCSRGVMVRRLQQVASASYGVDVNEAAIKRGFVPNLAVMDATKLEFPDSTFDKLYSAHTIEHIPNLSLALKEMARVLKKGGKVLLIYPAEPIQGMFALFAAVILWKNPRSIHVHKLTPQKLEQVFLPGAGLKVVSSKLTLFPRPEYHTVLEKT